MARYGLATRIRPSFLRRSIVSLTGLPGTGPSKHHYQQQHELQPEVLPSLGSSDGIPYRVTSRSVRQCGHLMTEIVDRFSQCADHLLQGPPYSEEMQVDTPAAPDFPATKRDSLNGCWILDRSKGSPSMRSYLETMNVNEMAIAAHDKAEKDFETYHTLDLGKQKVKIVKRSRVNNDLVVELDLGQERITLLQPGDREKRSLAVSNSPAHLQIQSSLHTVNGKAEVLDIKTLEEDELGQTWLKQQLTITNLTSGTACTTVRWFRPYDKTPPHLVDQPVAEAK